jgi:hypothetical protein
MSDPCARRHASWGVAEFRERFPGLRFTHLPDCGLQFEGELVFRAQKDGYDEIEDSYRIRVVIPGPFPNVRPQVFETAGRIAEGYHAMADNSFCLGSPIRIRQQLNAQPTLIGAVDRLIVPYLYNHSYQERTGQFPVGELVHGVPGLVEDYEDLFQLNGLQQCIEALDLLGSKKRIANKRPCPCGSGRRLGKCHNSVLNPLRKLAPRNFYKFQSTYLRSEE